MTVLRSNFFFHLTFQLLIILQYQKTTQNSYNDTVSVYFSNLYSNAALTKAINKG